MKIKKFATIDSTQTYCRQNFHNLDDETIVVSKIQTAGYGRSGRWDSQNANVYYSQVFKNCSLTAEQLNMQVTLAVYDLLSNYTNFAHIKIPNDIYVKEKKLAGILVEVVDQGYVCGVGINICEPETENKIGLCSFLSAEIDFDMFYEKLAAGILQKITEPLDWQKWNQAMKIFNHPLSLENRKTKEVEEQIIVEVTPEYLITEQKRLPSNQYKILVDEKFKAVFNGNRG